MAYSYGRDSRTHPLTRNVKTTQSIGQQPTKQLINHSIIKPIKTNKQTIHKASNESETNQPTNQYNRQTNQLTNQYNNQPTNAPIY